MKLTVEELCTAIRALECFNVYTPIRYAKMAGSKELADKMQKEIDRLKQENKDETTTNTDTITNHSSLPSI